MYNLASSAFKCRSETMSRPTTKTDLIELANIQYDNLWQFINSMTEDEQLESFNFDTQTAGKEAHWKRDKNIRDVLIHLYEWHQLLINWINANQNGEEKPFLLAPYNWKTYGQMNIDFFNKHQTTPYDTSKELLNKSHSDVMTLIETFSSDELFAKKQFNWTGTTTLGSYCASATASHYDWAMKKIKKHIKSYKGVEKS